MFEQYKEKDEAETSSFSAFSVKSWLNSLQSILRTLLPQRDLFENAGERRLSRNGYLSG